MAGFRVRTLRQFPTLSFGAQKLCQHIFVSDQLSPKSVPVGRKSLRVLSNNKGLMTAYPKPYKFMKNPLSIGNGKSRNGWAGNP